MINPKIQKIKTDFTELSLKLVLCNKKQWGEVWRMRFVILRVSCTQESRKLVASVLGTVLFFDKGRSGNLSLVSSSTFEVASCNISIASSSSFIELSRTPVIVGV